MKFYLTFLYVIIYVIMFLCVMFLYLFPYVIIYVIIYVHTPRNLYMQMFPHRFIIICSYFLPSSLSRMWHRSPQDVEERKDVMNLKNG